MMSAQNVQVVIAGHAHYDHLLDVPTVIAMLPRATVYAGYTAVNLLATQGVTNAVAIGDRAGTAFSVGRWTTVGSVRFMPFVSEHAAHVHHVKLYVGHVSRDIRPPRYAWDWKEGEPLAFLIDFLGPDSAVAFRVYYDDAAHDWPYGYPDAATLREHDVDVAIVCAASFDQTSAYPADLLDYLHPKHVLVGHWEDFFSPYEAPDRPLRSTDVAAFTKIVRDVVGENGFTLPARRTAVRFAPPAR